MTIDMIEKHASISIMSVVRGSGQFFSNKILKSIQKKGRGSVFTANDFTRIGTRAAVDLVLSRLVRRGLIRRLARGLYDYPVLDKELGPLAPTVEALVKALSGAGRIRLQPSGSYAANSLGLSEQVPMRIVFLTDGLSRRIMVKGREIQLRRTTPKNMVASGRLGGQLVQALRYLGRNAVDETLLSRIRRAVPEEKRRSVLKDAGDAPVWIRQVLQQALVQDVSAHE